MAKHKRILKQCDLFGYPIQLTLSNHSKYQSVLGGVISIGMGLFFILLFYNGVISLLTYNVFLVQIHEVYEQDPGYQRADPSNFMWAAELVAHSNGTDPDLSDIFNISISQIQHVSGSTISRNIAVETCSYDHFALLNFQGFTIDKEIELKKFKCPPINESFVQKGGLGSSNFTYFSLGVSLSNKYTREQLIKFMNQHKITQFDLNMKLTNFYVDPYKSGYPQALIMTQKFTFFPYIYHNEINVVVYAKVFEDKRSLIPYYQDSIKTVYHSIEQDAINSQYRILNDQTSLLDQRTHFVSVNFVQSQKSYYMVKTYQSIDEFLAYLGGIMMNVIAFIGIAMHYYNKFGFYVMLANKLYIFNVPLDGPNGQLIFKYDDFQRKIKNRIDQVSKIMNTFRAAAKRLIMIRNSGFGKLQTNGQLEMSELPKEIKLDEEVLHQKRNFLEFMFDEILQCQTQIQLTFMYMCYRLFCRKLWSSNNEVRLIDKAIRTIFKDMDVVVMMDKLKEIDKIKHILLTSSQMTVFDYTPKPLITLHSGDRRASKFQVLEALSPKKQKHRTKTAINQEQLSTNEYNRGTKRHNSHHSHSRHPSKKKTGSQMFQRKFQFDSKDKLFSLYEAYDELQRINETDSGKHASKRINQNLIDLLGSNLKQIFETSYKLGKYEIKQKAVQDNLITEPNPEFLRDIAHSNAGDLATLDKHHTPAVYNRDFNPTKDILFSPPKYRQDNIKVTTEGVEDDQIVHAPLFQRQYQKEVTNAKSEKTDALFFAFESKNISDSHDASGFQVSDSRDQS